MKSGRGSVVLLLAAVSCVVVIAAVWSMRRQIREQYYLWRLESKSHEERRAAAIQLGKMRSAKAIPRLVSLLRSDESARGALHVGMTSAFREVKLKYPVGIRGSAVPGSELAIPTLQEESWETFWIGHALADTGLAAVPALLEPMKDQDKLTRVAACDICFKILSNSGVEGMPYLVQIVEDKSFDFQRMRALEELYKLRGSAKEVVPALCRILSSENAEASGWRFIAAWLLGDMGGGATEAIPVLERTAQDAGDAMLRAYATYALQRIKGEP